MLLAWLLLTSVAVAAQPLAPVTCLHAYFGLPESTPAEPTALRAAILRRYPLGTPLSESNVLRRAAFKPGAVCETTSAGTHQAADTGTVETIVLRARRGVSPAAAVARLRWGPSGLAEVRVALGAPAVWRDP